MEALVADFTSEDLAMLVSRRVSQKVVQTGKCLTTLVTPEQQTIEIFLTSNVCSLQKHLVCQNFVEEQILITYAF